MQNDQYMNTEYFFAGGYRSFALLAQGQQLKRGHVSE